MRGDGVNDGVNCSCCRFPSSWPYILDSIWAAMNIEIVGRCTEFMRESLNCLLLLPSTAVYRTHGLLSFQKC